MVDSSLIQLVELTITAAEVAALSAAPFTLVAAPGATKVAEFMSAILILDYTAPAFTEIADNLAIRYTDGSGTIVSAAIEMTGFIDQVVDKVINAVPVKDTILLPDAALVLHNTGDAEFAGGGGSGLRVKMFYRVHTHGL